MKKASVIAIILCVCSLASFRFETGYRSFYLEEITHFKKEQQGLLQRIGSATLSSDAGRDSIRRAIHQERISLKKIDFWLRYLEPIVQKHVNGPLPVEWETEVFEKFEKPYRRTGAGLTIAEQYLDEPDISRDSLQQLIRMAVTAMDTYTADSITTLLNTPAHLFFANRLFLLNLAAIYTTGFECPDSSRVIPELKGMLPAVRNIYLHYNSTFSSTALTRAYLQQYDRMVNFTNSQTGHVFIFRPVYFYTRLCKSPFFP